MAFAQFMAQPGGRSVRILAGLVLAGWGWSMNSTLGWIVFAAGLVVLAAGAFNVCLFGPLLGAPLRGSELRKS